MSKPKPKNDDPELKQEPKRKKLKRMSSRQLRERAERVKQRQDQALQKIEALAITDGTTVGKSV